MKTETVGEEELRRASLRDRMLGKNSVRACTHSRGLKVASPTSIREY